MSSPVKEQQVEDFEKGPYKEPVAQFTNVFGIVIATQLLFDKLELQGPTWGLLSIIVIPTLLAYYCSKTLLRMMSSITILAEKYQTGHRFFFYWLAAIEAYDHPLVLLAIVTIFFVRSALFRYCDKFHPDFTVSMLHGTFSFVCAAIIFFQLERDGDNYYCPTMVLDKLAFVWIAVSHGYYTCDFLTYDIREIDSYSHSSVLYAAHHVATIITTDYCVDVCQFLLKGYTSNLSILYGFMVAEFSNVPLWLNTHYEFSIHNKEFRIRKRIRYLCFWQGLSLAGLRIAGLGYMLSFKNLDLLVYAMALGIGGMSASVGIEAWSANNYFKDGLSYTEEMHQKYLADQKEKSDMGATGLRISAISFGSWVTFGIVLSTRTERLVEDEKSLYEKNCKILTQAYRLGVNFFDTAEMYAEGGAETILGKWIKSSGVDRETLVICTKIFYQPRGKGFSNNMNPNSNGVIRKRLLEGIKGSLKRLQLEYVDIVYAHRADRHCSIQDVVVGMNHLLKKGYAFYWGTSEWTAGEIREARAIAKKLKLIGPSVEQPQYSMIHRNRFEVEYKRLFAEGMGSTVYSPLANGVLTGKYADGIPESSRFGIQKKTKTALHGIQKRFAKNSAFEQEIIGKSKKFKQFCENKNLSCAQVALAWCLKNSNVTSVICGASKVSQVIENCRAVQLYQNITKKQWEEIDSIWGFESQKEYCWRKHRRWGGETVCSHQSPAGINPNVPSRSCD